MEAASSSETSISIYQTAQYHIKTKVFFIVAAVKTSNLTTLRSCFKLLKKKSCHHLPVINASGFLYRAAEGLYMKWLEMAGALSYMWTSSCGPGLLVWRGGGEWCWQWTHKPSRLTSFQEVNVVYEKERERVVLLSLFYNLHDSLNWNRQPQMEHPHPVIKF
jgi:hypothetical protein